MKRMMTPAITIRTLALTGMLAAPALLTGCASSSSTPRDRSALEEIDPTSAYNQRRMAEAREQLSLATQLQREEKYGEALEAYRRALELDDKLYAAWNNMGQLLMQQENYADAVSAFQIASSIEPSDPRPLYNIGLAYQTVGWASDAYDNYENALQRDPYYIPAMRGIARSAEMLGKGDRKLLETIKQAQLREREEKWRNYFRDQYRRVEILLETDK
ncbi:MAG: tetratricopeptide repeat protein [Erythrobacter sp.]|nr:tetratricopeptide repeat protein [Erythrobacter sp.]